MFWYRSEEDDALWLFKYPRQNTGENWAEKITSEVAAKLGIPHAKVELATFQGRKGSSTRTFAGGGRELVHGNELLAGRVLDDDPQKGFRNADHTLANIWRALDATFAPVPRARMAKRLFASYLVLDALIGNNGWRYTSEAARRRLAVLQPREKLHVALELTNPVTGLAIQLQTLDYLMIGWAPRDLVADIARSTAGLCGDYVANVVTLNPIPAPWKQRLLVELRGPWPGDEPMTTGEFEALVP